MKKIHILALIIIAIAIADGEGVDDHFVSCGKAGPLDHVAFVEVKLNDTREVALAAFNAAVIRIGEIEQAHMIASSFDYLLKIRTQNMRDYRTVLAEKISTLPHVASTSTYVAMQAIKENALADVI